MLITCLSAAALFLDPMTTTAPVGNLGGSLGGSAGEGHGKIAWFQGSYEDALAEAKASKKPIFIDFWTTWCGWCKRLDKDTFSNDSVAEVMKGFVCLSIDAESKTGRPVAARFTIKGFPALFIVAPDGSIEDLIGGYLKPDQLKKEAERILSGKGTAGQLRRQVEADKSNIENRHRLAQKLEQIGDIAGRDAQMAEIKKLDPDGKSLPMRRLAFEGVIAKINEKFQKDRSLDLDGITAFLENETHPELLFQGHYALIQMHTYLAQEATGKGDAAGAKQHTAAARASMKAAWPHVPEEQIAPFGNTVAWAYYEARDELAPADKLFALEVAEKAANSFKDADKTDDEHLQNYVHTLDTYACCLFMNGKKAEALRQIERCKELDPKADAWKDRLAEFQK